ncbi:hypothetical protein HKX48_006754, partial [Thoreauomyces humboldtii]
MAGGDRDSNPVWTDQGALPPGPDDGGTVTTSLFPVPTGTPGTVLEYIHFSGHQDEKDGEGDTVSGTHASSQAGSSSIPIRGVLLKLNLDHRFEAIPEPTDASSVIDLFVDAGSFSELLDPISDGELKRRGLWDSWKKWVAEKTTATVSKTSGFNVHRSFEQGILTAKAVCDSGAAHASANLDIGISGFATINGVFSATITAQVVPPKIHKAYAFFRSGGEIQLTLQLDGDAALTYTQEMKQFYAQNITPYQIPGIISLGPRIELHAGFSAALEVDATFTATAGITLPSLFLAVGDNDETESGTDDSLATAKLTKGAETANFQADISLAGNIEVMVMPRALLAVVVFNGFAEAGLGMDFVGTIGADLSAGAHASGNETGQVTTTIDPVCLDIYARFDVDAYVGGTFSGYSMDYNPQLYTTERQVLWEKCLLENPTDAGQCPETDLGWPATPVGTSAQVPCPQGSALTTIACLTGGIWDTPNLAGCNAAMCQGAKLGTGWPDTFEGATAQGPCINGLGVASAVCDTSGTWNDPNYTGCRTDVCFGEARGPNWPDAYAGEVTNVPCPAPDYGMLSATCNDDLTWTDIDSSGCTTAPPCSADGFWSQTLAGQVATIQ